jgi:hypothetical protein
MKKLLVVLLAAGMVWAVSAASFGAVSISGTIPVVYDFFNKYDYFDKADLTFRDAVNDKLSTVVSFRWNYNYINGKTAATTFPVGATNGSYGPASTSTGTMEDPAGNMYPWLDQIYATYKTGFGKFSVGMFNTELWGGLTVMNDTAAPYRIIKAPFGLRWVAPEFFDGFIGKVVYLRDGSNGTDDAITSNPGTYIVTLGYASCLWGFDYNYVNLEGANYVTAQGHLGTTDLNNGKIGYVLNAYIHPVEALKVFTVIGQDQNDAKALWIGANFNVAKWYGIIEYNLDKTDIHYNDGYEINGLNPAGETGVLNEIGSNRYGFELGYCFTDSFNVAYRFKLFDKNSSTLGSAMEEIRATFKFK